ncbi:MAG: aldo/keto reductase [Desulfovibrionaceae bacterium]|nr:aldo/keto reductase [Desulfovibrionaceae bacterium]
MRYTTLGTTEIKISRICMGCMGFGDPKLGHHSWTLNEEHTREIVRHGFEQGINFFDTAIAYQSGTSEQYVGRALRDIARREEVVLATKFLPRTAAEIDAKVTAQEHISRMLDKSLRNLGMDYVDLYIYHMWDWHTPLYDIMEGLNRAVQSGKVRALGISNCFAWQIAKANALAEREGFAKFVSVQGHYNLLFREEEREMVPYCQEEGISMTPYSALAAGRLSRTPEEPATKRLVEDKYARFKYDAVKEQDMPIIRRVAELATRRGVSMTEIALAWLLRKVASPVVGMTKTAHVDSAVLAVDLELTDEEVAWLEELYTPHPLAGVMAENKPATSLQTKSWSIGKQTL